MPSGKLVWLIVVQFTIFKGICCVNSTQKTAEKAIGLLNATLSLMNISFNKEPISSTETSRQTSELSAFRTQNTTLNETVSINSTNVSQTQLEIIEIFSGNSNSSINTTHLTEQSGAGDIVITNYPNGGSENLTCIDQPWNDTFKTNYLTMAESAGYSEDIPIFKLSNSAAIAAGVFLISAVLGYISCVGYRRFLQRKYGNSQILIGEEVYDTTDLRNFEI